MSGECPCENCILIAICRLKVFYKLLKDCDLLYIYEPNLIDIKKRAPQSILNIEYAIEPITWKYLYISDNPPRSRVTSIGKYGLGRKYYDPSR